MARRIFSTKKEAEMYAKKQYKIVAVKAPKTFGFKKPFNEVRRK